MLAPDHPNLVPAPPHEPEVTALIEHADLAIVIGSDLDQMNTMEWRLPLPARRVAINVDAADAAKNYPMVGRDRDRRARRRARRRASSREREPWAGDLPALGRAIRGRIAAEPATTATRSNSSSAPKLRCLHDATVFADMCIAGYWLAGHYRVPTRRGLHYPMGWGTLGFALPAAIGRVGRRAADRSRSSATAACCSASASSRRWPRRNAACTIVVVDDGGYGMLRYGTATTAANELPAVDFVGAADAFGIPAVRVEGVGTDYAHGPRRRGRLPHARSRARTRPAAPTRHDNAVLADN